MPKSRTARVRKASAKKGRGEMRKITDRLKSIRVFNPHNFTMRGDGKVYIAHTTGHGRGWAVVGIGFETDSDGPWYNHGAKTFGTFAENKYAMLVRAKNWASEKFHINEEWVKTPYREAWVPKSVYEKVMAILDEQEKRNLQV